MISEALKRNYSLTELNLDGARQVEIVRSIGGRYNIINYKTISEDPERR